MGTPTLLELNKQALKIQEQIVKAMEGESSSKKFAADVLQRKADKANRLEKFSKAVTAVNAAKITDALKAAGFARGSNNEATGQSSWGRPSKDGVLITIKAGKFTAMDKEKQYLIKDEPVANIPAFMTVLNKKK